MENKYTYEFFLSKSSISPIDIIIGSFTDSIAEGIAGSPVRRSESTGLRFAATSSMRRVGML